MVRHRNLTPSMGVRYCNFTKYSASKQRYSMNYRKIYETIINTRKLQLPDGYTETHHIIPKSLGGSDTVDNLIKLTAKEHFICHLLLTKMYPKGSNEYYKMCTAFLMMLVQTNKQQRYITSRKYESLKKEFANRMSALGKGSGNSQYGTMWIHNITLKECKKVPKDSIIEDGWQKGRVVDWDKKFKTYSIICKNCNVEFTTSEFNRKCCSENCAKTIVLNAAAQVNRKKVIDHNGIIYNSLHDAGIALGLTPEGVARRIKHGMGSYLT